MSDTTSSRRPRGTDKQIRATGPDSIAELRASSDQMLARVLEFPFSAAGRPTDLSRRDFLALLGASAALAGLGACVREPAEKILPYVHSTGDSVPGTPLHFATSMTMDGFATGLLVTSHEGRPTKIEGNPDHPASLGVAGVFEQASVLQLYDPHRAGTVRAGRRASSWNSLAAALNPTALRARAGSRGSGLAVLLEPTSSSVVIEMIARFRNQFPEAQLYFHAPLVNPVHNGARSALREPLLTQYDFGRSDVVVSLGADFCASGPFHLRYARQIGARRREKSRMRHRLHVAESAPTPTGILADERTAASPAELQQIALALLAAVASDSRVASRIPHLDVLGNAKLHLREQQRVWVHDAAQSLLAGGATAAVVAGPYESAEVHAVVHALNSALGSVGNVVTHTQSPIVGAGETDNDLASMASALRSRAIDTLVMIGGNPVYAAPANLRIGDAVRAVRNTVYCGLYDDETSAVTTWFAPTTHYLESWDDARAHDGTASVVQPLISPLHDGRTTAEILAMLAGSPETSAHDMVRGTVSASEKSAAGFEHIWNEALALGVIPGTRYSPVSAQVNWDAVGKAASALSSLERASGIQIRFTESSAVRDGSFADNAWLQELPDPITKLTWDNALLMSPATAVATGVQTGDEVTVTLRDRRLDAPVIVVPGHADDTVSLALGYGRSGAEAIARGVGVNANVVRNAEFPFAEAGAQIVKTGAHRDLAMTQDHWSLEGRGTEILGAPLAAPLGAPLGAPKQRRPLTLYEPQPPAPDGFGGDQWAMVIDLYSCTGCSACVVACQAENNIPVVGREGVLKSREMQWMRIDRYVEGPAEAPSMSVQPMLCQHCEKAPCEYVCPVEATVHSDDGLNEMVYNRCVGTRFCSNNCPYKVRRFNWFDYTGEISETERMVKNPEVTIRSRGVMEKCTFCVQRIRQAQIDAQLAGAERTGPVVTACAQTCPTGAIVFGSLTAPSSEVARLRDDPRAYSALDSLGTVPRVRYLARREAERSVNDGPSSGPGYERIP